MNQQSEADLRRLSPRELVALYEHLCQEPNRDRVPPVGDAASAAKHDPEAIDRNCRERLSEVQTEIERRCQEGDDEFYRIAAERLEQDAAQLPPNEPVGVFALTPEQIGKLKDRELTSVYGRYQSQLAVHRDTFGNPNEIKDWMARGVVEGWRSKVERVLRLLAGEMLRRDLSPAASERNVFSPASRNWYESSPEIVRRRQIVLKNPKFSAKKLCKLFDSERIPVPEGWEKKYGVTTWLSAYGNPKSKPLVQKIISTDKRAVKQSGRS